MIHIKRSLYFSWDARKFATIGVTIGIIISFIYISSISYSHLILTKSILLNKEGFLLNVMYDVSKSSQTTKKCTYGKDGPRVLCAVFTYQKNYATKALAVQNTWGKRCDKTIFMTSIKNETDIEPADLNLIHLNMTNNYSRLTDKTIETILYSHSHLIDEFDWFFKADDDTYVIVENLKYFLAGKCNDDMKTYGFNYKPHPPERFTFDFNSGGAGYLISNKAIRSFSQKYLEDKTFCRNTTGAEDADLAFCLQAIGIQPGDSRDKKGKERFHPLSFETTWSLPSNHWTFMHSKYPIRKGQDCCSDTTISFHYTSNQQMMQLDYLLYNLRPKFDFKSQHDDYYS